MSPSCIREGWLMADDERGILDDLPVTRRQLNRATLARQLLLRDQRRSVSGTLEQVAGLQAQASRAGYLGLWARVQGFEPCDLTELLEQRMVVKATLMRGTIHLVTAGDYLLFRSALQPQLTKLATAYLKRNAPRSALEELERQTRPFLSEPRSLGELRGLLERLYPGADVMRLAYAVRMHLALIHVPSPDATWGFPAQPRFVDAESWLGRPALAPAGPRELILRYLRAFGPATVADVAAWSGLTGLKAEIERLRPDLSVHRGENGAELFDVPDAPRPRDDSSVAPVFVPEWDSVLLAHADRGRIVPDELQKPFFKAQVQLIGPAVLLDGFVVGRWRLETRAREPSLQILPLVRLEAKDREALAREGERLLAFARPDTPSGGVTFG